MYGFFRFLYWSVKVAIISKRYGAKVRPEYTVRFRSLTWNEKADAKKSIYGVVEQILRMVKVHGKKEDCVNSLR